MGEDSFIKSNLGLMVFFIGIGLLILTFYFTYSVFVNPGLVSGFANLAPSVDGELGEILEPVLKMASYLIPVFLLWVMGSISGRIASKGLSMDKSSPKDGSEENNSTEN